MDYNEVLETARTKIGTKCKYSAKSCLRICEI